MTGNNQDVTAPNVMRWQTFVNARASKLENELKSQAENQAWLTDDWLKSLAARNQAAISHQYKFAILNMTLILLLYVTKYTPSMGLSLYGVKFSEIKNFPEVLLFISSLLSVYISTIGLVNLNRASILRVCIRHKYPHTLAKYVSAAYFDTDLFSNMHELPHENRVWLWGSVRLALVYAVSVFLLILALSVAAFWVQIKVTTDVWQNSTLPYHLHFGVVVIAVTAIILNLMATALCFFPWPYKDSSNHRAFYNLKDTDPAKFHLLYPAWLAAENRREKIRNGFISTVMMLLGCISGALVSEKLDVLFKSITLITIALSAVAMFVLGGWLFTKWNQNSQTKFFAGSYSNDDERKNLHSKLQHRIKRRTQLIPAFVGIALSFALLFVG